MKPYNYTKVGYMNRILEPLVLTALAVLLLVVAISVGNQKINQYIDEQRELGRQVELLTGS